MCFCLSPPSLSLWYPTTGRACVGCPGRWQCCVCFLQHEVQAYKKIIIKKKSFHTWTHTTKSCCNSTFSIWVKVISVYKYNHDQFFQALAAGYTHERGGCTHHAADVSTLQTKTATNCQHGKVHTHRAADIRTVQRKKQRRDGYYKERSKKRWVLQGVLFIAQTLEDFPFVQETPLHQLTTASLCWQLAQRFPRNGAKVTNKTIAGINSNLLWIITWGVAFQRKD